MSRVSVIGTGYVGLTTGACLAHLGHEVVCADVDPAKVELLRGGHIPIFEQGLEELVQESLAAQRLSFVLGANSAVADAEFVLLCVQTPQGADGAADLSFVEQASAEIGPQLMTGAVVITKSTVPVGSALIVERALGRTDVAVVSNPEFLREGQAVYDCLHPDRIVIGSDDQGAAIRVAALYERINAPLIVTDPATAEAIKYACNAFLATKVSFINAIANVCQAVGADVRDVVLGMGYDKRIGFEFLKPGPGWGGSCLLGTESVLARRGDDVRLLTFEDLFAEVEKVGVEGWEVLAWRPEDPSPEFARVAAFTSRPWDGEIVEVRTKLGRRVLCTPDHPFVVGDGTSPEPVGVRMAGTLTESDWLPIARNAPLPIERLYVGSPLDGLPTDEDFWRAVGKSCHDKALPDLIWSEPDAHKRALLRGLWDGDGSWSLVAGGPSVVLEYGTVSRALADGMLRLLGDLGIAARLKVGRTAKSTVDTYWLMISGADQIDDALWLFPDDEQEVIRASIERQQKRIKPTGYRRFSKNASWVRVSSVERRPWKGTVYSLEVPSAGTIVTTGGLVVHNCFPKDSQALVRIAEEAGYHFELLKGVIAVNEEQFELVASRIERMAGRQLGGVTVGVWGLTFKAGTDDLRDSPAVAVIKRLRAKGAAVQAYDPTAAGKTLPRPLAELGIEVCADPYAACNGAAVLAVLTEWDEFRWLDFAKVAELMDQPAILDGRNLLDPAPLRRRGFQYEGMGRS